MQIAMAANQPPPPTEKDLADADKKKAEADRTRQQTEIDAQDANIRKADAVQRLTQPQQEQKSSVAQ